MSLFSGCSLLAPISCSNKSRPRHQQKLLSCCREQPRQAKSSQLSGRRYTSWEVRGVFTLDKPLKPPGRGISTTVQACHIIEIITIVFLHKIGSMLKNVHYAFSNIEKIADKLICKLEDFIYNMFQCSNPKTK